MQIIRCFKKICGRDLAVLATVAALSAAAIVGLLQWKSRNILNMYVRHATDRAVTDFTEIGMRVEQDLEELRREGESGRLSPAEPEQAAGILTNYFPRMEKLSGIFLAQRNGAGFYLLRDGTVEPDPDGTEQSAEKRPWLAETYGLGKPYWTDVYRIPAFNEPGVSVALAWTGPDGIPEVASFDILLDDFFSAMQRLAPTPSSRIFVFTSDGRLFVPETDSMSGRFQAVSIIQDETVRRGFSVWNGRTISPNTDSQAEQIMITKERFGRETWWCGFVPLSESYGSVWLGVMIPEADLVGDVWEWRIIYWAVGIVVVIAVAVIYRMLFRRRTVLPFEMELDASEVSALVGRGETRFVEFKATMRMNLHSRKPGKEIELAWLKGVAAFLNTDGGVLLLGVTDAGEVSGLERDVFESEDRCRLHFKNLIAAHLGADVSKFIRFSLVHLEGKTVGVVQCSRSARPVYLRDGNKETFYIRNGPSSDELPASRMVAYIAENWK